MRLVSALYNDHYPFHLVGKFREYVASSDPYELSKGDCLLVWGGSDIHPSLYGRSRHQWSGATKDISSRDRVEWAMMNQARSLGVPIIGVCRGAQMLCALAGGILIHKVVTFDGRELVVNSLHHQMMYPKDTNHNIVAWSEQIRSPKRYGIDGDIPVEKEPEFVHFPDVKGFAIQWHPEMMAEDEEATTYANDYIARHL
jgi:gamma-glutamyl-gamma-aminobutyrate hydrolase PuuD